MLSELCLLLILVLWNWEWLLSMACGGCQCAEEGLWVGCLPPAVKPKNIEHNTVLRTVWLLCPHKNYYWKNTSWFKAAVGLLWPCWVTFLLQWKERSRVCRAGSASAFRTIPGNRICSPGLSISFWVFHSTSRFHLMVEIEPFLSHWIPKSCFLLSFCGGKNCFQERKHKEPPWEPSQIWQCGSKAWRDGHCTQLLEIKCQPFSLGWICMCKLFTSTLFCIFSHGTSNETQSSSSVGVKALCLSDLLVPANRGLVPDFVFPWLLTALFPNPVFNTLSGWYSNRQTFYLNPLKY